MAEKNQVSLKRYGPVITFFAGWIFLLAASVSFAATDIGGKPEKSDVTVTYAQPSGAFTPIWVAYEAGLFKKYGLNAKLQLLNPQVSAQAVVSEEAIFNPNAPISITPPCKEGRVKISGGRVHRLS